MAYLCQQASLNHRNSRSQFSRRPRKLHRVLTTKIFLLNKVRLLFRSPLSIILVLLAAGLLGQDLYDGISSIAIRLYRTAAQYAESKGVILADTKFEFGLLPSSPTLPEKRELILVDEVLTPDSSRYWPLDGYAPGKPQPSFDKQYVRDWLVASGFRKGLESGPEDNEGQGWTIDEAVARGTRARYQEVVDLLTQ